MAKTIYTTALATYSRNFLFTFIFFYHCCYYTNRIFRDILTNEVLKALTLTYKCLISYFFTSKIFHCNEILFHNK